MPSPTLSLSAVTATTASVAVTGLAADGTLQLQYSARHDFKGCPSPKIEGLARSSPISLVGLNQDAAYYVRARSKRADNTLEDWSTVLGFRTPVSTPPTTTPASVMIEPALIGIPHPVLAWSADDEVAGFPVTNLGVDAPVAWRSSSGHAFTADVGYQPVDTIALLASNLPEGATVTVHGDDTDPSSTPDYSYGPVAFRASANLAGRYAYHGLIQLPEVKTYRFWRVEISATLFSDILHLEHAVFTKAIETKNYSTGKSEVAVDMGGLDRTRTGNPIRSTGLRMRRVDFQIAMLTEEQFETKYGDFRRRVGLTDPVLCVPNMKSNAFLHDRILYGAIVDGREVNPVSPRFTRQFVIESLI